MKTTITVGILLILLASGFTILSYDRTDDGVKLMSDDDLKEIEKEYIEKIPLYYDIDNPNVILTRDDNGDFSEVIING